MHACLVLIYYLLKYHNLHPPHYLLLPHWLPPPFTSTLLLHALVALLLVSAVMCALYTAALASAYTDCSLKLGSPSLQSISHVPLLAHAWGIVHPETKLLPIPSIRCHLPRSLPPVLASTLQFLDLVSLHHHVSLEPHRVQLNDLRDQLAPHQDTAPHLKPVLSALHRVAHTLTGAEESIANFQIRLINSVYRLSSHIDLLQHHPSLAETASSTTNNVWPSFWRSAIAITSLRGNTNTSPGLAVLAVKYKRVLIQEIDQLIQSSTTAHADYENVYIALSTLLREIAPAAMASQSNIAEYSTTAKDMAVSSSTSHILSDAASSAGETASYGLRWVFRTLFGVGTVRYNSLLRTVRDLERLAQETKQMESKVLQLIDELKWKRRRLQAISTSSSDMSYPHPHHSSNHADHDRLIPDDFDTTTTPTQSQHVSATSSGEDDDTITIAPWFFNDPSTTAKLQRFFIDKLRIKRTIQRISDNMNKFPKDLTSLRQEDQHHRLSPHIPPLHAPLYSPPTQPPQ